MSDENAPENDDLENGSPEEQNQDDSKGTKPGNVDELPEWARDQIAKARKEAAGYRAKLREAEPLAQKARELQESQKTESEKLTERLTGAEKRAQEAELRALRLEVAADKGLTPAQARRLVGTSKEELEEDADDLLSSFGAKNDTKPTPKVPGRPKEKLRGGGDPDEPVEETDPRKLADAIGRGR